MSKPDPERRYQDEIADLKQQNHELQEQINWLARQLFGKKAEKGIPDHPDQPDLFEGEDGERGDDGDQGDDADASEERAYQKKSKRKPRKTRLPEHLPIEEEIIDPDEVKDDPEQYKYIDEVHTDRLAFKPPVFYIKRITRRKYIRKDSLDDGGVPRGPVIAPLPAQLIDRGIADGSFVAHVLVSKYRDHLPLDRQSKINKERYQIDVSKQTLCNMVSSAAEWLRLVYEEMSRKAFDSGYVQLDETPIKYQAPGTGQTATGYFWTVHSPGGSSIYHWKTGRSTECLEEIVPAGYQGVIQCDAYAVYPRFAGQRRGIDLCGCLAHIRRKFWEACEQGQNRTFNQWVLRQIRLLYQIEARLRSANASPTHRELTRSSESAMIFNRLGRLLGQAQRHRRFLPKSLTGRAISYALDQWQRMRVWLTNGNVEIDNNLVENKIRPTKLGAKNWLFIGSATAGETSAIIYSVITSCVNLGIEPYRYLKDVLQRLPTMKTTEIGSILPENWSPVAECR